MILEAVGTLFPAIPLAIAALNFRYTSLAGLMRNIFTQIEEVENCNGDKDILFRELRVLKTRMTLVKYSLFFAGVSFILNLFALFFFVPFNDKYSIRISGRHHSSPHYKY